MKKIFITLLFCLFIQHIIAQVYYFKGEWTKVNTQELFTGIFKITIKDKSIVTGELIWTYRAIDSKQQDLVEFYKGKKGRIGLEYTSGLFDDKTNDIYFEGTEKKDPYDVIGLDKYHLKLSNDRQGLYGKTESNGSNDGLFYATRINSMDGEKKFTLAKSKIRKK